MRDPYRVGYLAELPPGVTYRQLDYWTRLGYLRPANADEVAGSRYSRRLWTESEVDVAVMIGALRAAGLDLPVAARAAREFSEGAESVSIAPGISLRREVAALHQS